MGGHDEENKVGLRTLWRVPRQGNFWGEPQTNPNAIWGELFYDLLIVASFIKLSHAYSHDFGEKCHMGEFLLFLGIIWNSWIGQAFFFATFVAECFFSDLVFLIHMLGVFGQVVNLGGEPLHGQRESYAISVLVTRAATTVHWLTVYLTAERDTPPWKQGRRMCGVHAVSVALAILAAAVPDSTAATVFWTVGVAWDMFSPSFLANFFGVHVPIGIGHISERFGSIIMLVLGECVLTILMPNVASYTTRQWVTMICMFVVLHNIHLMYFHVSPSIELHAMRRSRKTGSPFMWFHIILAAAILILAAGFRNFVTGMQLNVLPSRTDIWNVCGPLAVISLSIIVIRMLHFWGRSKDTSINPLAYEEFRVLRGLWWALYFVLPVLFLIMPVLELANVNQMQIMIISMVLLLSTISGEAVISTYLSKRLMRKFREMGADPNHIMVAKITEKVLKVENQNNQNNYVSQSQSPQHPNLVQKHHQ